MMFFGRSFLINKSALRGSGIPKGSNSYKGTTSMNIYLANSHLRELMALSKNQALTTKFGNQTKFCRDFIEILISSDIPYNDKNLVEIK